ncbi:MAG: preprotein translocase subunit SecE [Oscillospiraceae bacterium]|nr:preprotein translocase subunit SecE [Oscillospiraceae bacterium]
MGETKKKGIPAKITQFFSELKNEVKKVVWPSKAQIKNNTLVVLTMMSIMAVFIALLDIGMGALLDLFLRLLGSGGQ